MKILVTGGAGFIGSHVAERLLAEGHSVHVMDNLSSGTERNVPNAAVFHRLDVRDKQVKDLFADERFDAIVHHAAQMSVRHSVESPSNDAEINIIGFLNLLEAGRKHGLQKVVFASTGGAIYGEPAYVPQNEAHKMLPISPYGISKLSAEHYLAYYDHAFGISSVVLRYANVYGPRQRSEGEAGVVAIFINKMLAGHTPCIYGDGNQTRDYVYVGDVVEANIKGLTTKESRVFNVGTGVETTVNTLFDELARLTEFDQKPDYAAARPGEQQRSVLSFDKIKKELDWVPGVSLKEGLENTVAWFKSRAQRSL